MTASPNGNSSFLDKEEVLVEHSPIRGILILLIAIKTIVQKGLLWIMVLTKRALLRLHVEAVWGVKLARIEQNEMSLLPESARPDWQLYAADLTEGRVLVWREDQASAERAALFARLEDAWRLPELGPLPPDISREVAFHLVAEPKIDLPAAQQIVRPLTSDDYALIEAFQPGEAEAMLRPELRPLMGVVVNGRLLSLAHSSRRTVEACELGIDTLPEARRRRFALAATVAWSAAIVEEGLTPLYSAFAENSASLRLAVAAGYREFARAATIGLSPETYPFSPV